MSTTSKSPRAVTLEAFELAKQTLPAYSHHFSPKKFSQHQLFALLALKTHQRQDYRGVIAKLNGEIPRLMKAGGTVGLTIALVDGDHTVWRRGFGWADLARKVPVTANTLFHIGSVSKRCQRRP